MDAGGRARLVPHQPGGRGPGCGTQSIDALADELGRCRQLGIAWVVLHPGSHLGAGIEAGLEAVARNLDAAIEQAGTADTDLKVLLETTAGMGTPRAAGRAGLAAGRGTRKTWGCASTPATCSPPATTQHARRRLRADHGRVGARGHRPGVHFYPPERFEEGLAAGWTATTTSAEARSTRGSGCCSTTPVLPAILMTWRRPRRRPGRGPGQPGAAARTARALNLFRRADARQCLHPRQGLGQVEGEQLLLAHHQPARHHHRAHPRRRCPRTSCSGEERAAGGAAPGQPGSGRPAFGVSRPGVQADGRRHLQLPPAAAGPGPPTTAAQRLHPRGQTHLPEQVEAVVRRPRRPCPGRRADRGQHGTQRRHARGELGIALRAADHGQRRAGQGVQVNLVRPDAVDSRWCPRLSTPSASRWRMGVCASGWAIWPISSRVSAACTNRRTPRRRQRLGLLQGLVAAGVGRVGEQGRGDERVVVLPAVEECGRVLDGAARVGHARRREVDIPGGDEAQAGLAQARAASSSRK